MHLFGIWHILHHPLMVCVPNIDILRLVDSVRSEYDIIYTTDIDSMLQMKNKWV